MITRILASIAYSVEMILYMGIVHYAPALAMEAVTGISQITSIFAVGFICIFYSTLGGIRAVIISDVFQVGALYFILIFVVIGDNCYRYFIFGDNSIARRKSLQMVVVGRMPQK